MSWISASNSSYISLKSTSSIMPSLLLVSIFLPFLSLSEAAAILNARQAVTPPPECDVIPTWEVTSFNWFNSSNNLDCVTQSNARKSGESIPSQGRDEREHKYLGTDQQTQHQKASVSTLLLPQESWNLATATSGPVTGAASAPATRASRYSQPALDPRIPSRSALPSPVTNRATSPTRRASGATRSATVSYSAAVSHTASTSSETATPTSAQAISTSARFSLGTATTAAPSRRAVAWTLRLRAPGMRLIMPPVLFRMVKVL